MFKSYAQNFEDVILWRALKHVEKGVYVDVGAQDPTIDSVSLGFYEKGWRGIHADASASYARRLREARQDEKVVEAIIGNGTEPMRFFAVTDTGLSTSDEGLARKYAASGFEVSEALVPVMSLASLLDAVEGPDIHWLKVDVEGMEADVLASWGDSPRRPWILCVESTWPNSQTLTHQQWEHELIERGYEFVYFDGLSRFYVSREHEELKQHFGPGPNVFDGFALVHASGLVDLEPIRQQISLLQDRLAESERKSSHVASENDGLRSNISELEKTIENLRNHAEVFKKKILRLKKYNDKVRAMLSVRNLQLQAGLRGMDSERQDASEDREIVSVVDVGRSERDAARIALQELEAELQQRDAAIRDLTARLAWTDHELNLLRLSRSWRLTKPVRIARGVLRKFAHGVHAWLTFKPQSRPDRVVRSGIARAHGIVRRYPSSYRLARWMLDRSPRLQQRVRRFTVPSHLSDAIFPKTTGVAFDGFVDSTSVRLACDRLDFAKALTARASQHDRGQDNALPKLAYFSPLPPERTGIADYSAQLLPELCRYYDITLISEQSQIADDWLRDNVPVRSAEWFRENAGDFDRVMYHFGNSLFHSHMIPLLREVPGVVVLHDFFLSSMIAYLELHGEWGTIWTESLAYSHGHAALAERNDVKTFRRAIDNYPANFAILAQAAGVIVHSKHPVSLATEFYPAYSTRAWEVVPLPRIAPDVSKREDARAALGLKANEILVCTFGFLGSTKLNDRLLDAWIASPLAADENCKLVYVGAAHKDAYSDQLLRRIAEHGQGRVSVSGFASPEEYQRYLKAADIGVQLRSNSRGETSAAVLDCMAYGIATIANSNGSMAELPDDCLILLEDEFSEADLVTALVDLQQDEAKRQRLGARAAAYVGENHTVAYAAERYHAALEKFYMGSETLYDHQKLIECARMLPDGDMQAKLEMARGLTLIPNLPRPAKQILVDISALRNFDLRTGIQRVVRSVLGDFLASNRNEYRVEPVWMNKDYGEWRYHYARRYTMEFLGSPRADLTEQPVDVGEGDIFLALDFFAHGAIGASHTGVYEEWKQRGAQIAFVVYDILPVTMPHNFPEESGTVHELWLQAICNVADKLICISQAVADDVAAWLARTGHPRAGEIDIVAWPLGADIGASSPTLGIPAEGPELLERLERECVFLMVGTIEPRKGHAQVVDAFEERWAAGSKDVLVLIGGEGWKGVPPSQARSLPSLVSRLRNHPENGKRLIWLERASDEFLEKIYGAGDALIAASEGEGFGLPLIEAAQAGLPIIARDIPVFREVAGNDAFYFKASNGTELAAAVDEWKQLHEANDHPRSRSIGWVTWQESAELLMKALVTPASAGAPSVRSANAEPDEADAQRNVA
ncbi:glycosyltransferase [Aliihoeflea sp. 40Bstr573]|uniref:glycosyltransferase n=1 Tax=Aliihoeflea sp. 40Bstr573 TaxID=2696467 RepID=UPI002095C1D7|nr:glycosyltransferase [Aliihoeflea sp. 40Bstr573]MCO6387505.1 glycosyltransferase [Aliihoeflea sp. 40Bstr573]